MARRKSSDTFDSGSLFEALLDNARQKSGHEILTGAEADGLIVGLPLPALCLRYLFQSTVFPLGRITILFGTEGSCKSAFLYEMFRWHQLLEGMGMLYESESRDSADLRKSIMNYDTRRVSVQHCAQLNVWMESISERILDFQAKCDGTKSNPGPGRKSPLIMGVDSLTSIVSAKTDEKFLEKGVPDQRFATEAKMISDWLAANHPRLYGWPISLVFTNHNKPKLDQHGHPVANTPGGMAPKYNATYRLQTTRIGNIESAEWEGGRRIKFKMEKNSLGPGGKEMVADMLWTTQMVEGRPFQRTFWDWNAASIEVLLERMDHKIKAVGKRVKEIMDLTKSAGGRVWSDALGIPRESPVSFRQAGQLLEQRQDLMPALHAALGIAERTVFQPGVDYLEQRARSQQSAAAVAVGPLPPIDAVDDDESVCAEPLSTESV